MNQKAASQEKWDLVLEPVAPWWDLNLRDVWRYRDLLQMFVRRDFVAVYKQTVLGPVWFFLQPLLTTAIFTVVFSGLAKLPTDGMPPMLFYLAGITPWNYFAACLTKTSTTFTVNAPLFGKVFFPRLIMPLSVVVSTLIQFLIQFALFLAMLGWFAWRGADLQPHWLMIFLLTPVLLVLMGALGLGLGILVSSATTKYRDFAFLVTFGVQLAMYATPVIYPLSLVPERYAVWMHLNPMAPVIESFRAIYLGGTVPWDGLGISAGICAALLLLGVLCFKRVERTFMDTV